MVRLHVLCGEGLHPIDQRRLLDDVDLGMRNSLAEAPGCSSIEVKARLLLWLEMAQVPESFIGFASVRPGVK